MSSLFERTLIRRVARGRSARHQPLRRNGHPHPMLNALNGSNTIVPAWLRRTGSTRNRPRIGVSRLTLPSSRTSSQSTSRTIGMPRGSLATLTRPNVPSPKDPALPRTRASSSSSRASSISPPFALSLPERPRESMRETAPRTDVHRRSEGGKPRGRLARAALEEPTTGRRSALPSSARTRPE